MTNSLSTHPLPVPLQADINELVKHHKSLSSQQAIFLARRMQALQEKLASIVAEDSSRQDKDKEYILATTFTSFMYIMLALAEYAEQNNLETIDFVPVKELVLVLVQHGLISDHPSLERMLSTLASIDIVLQEHQYILTFYTHSGKTVEETFEQGIPSPRFVISGVSFENGARFHISHLFHEKNRQELDRFRKDSQKHFLTGGLVLMDRQQETILDYLDNYSGTGQFTEQEACPPLLIEGKGFRGKGYLKGLKLPSPAASMKHIYLIPGREGTPAFVRARSLMVTPFVAL